jgi:hypothetical protein
MRWLNHQGGKLNRRIRLVLGCTALAFAAVAPAAHAGSGAPQIKFYEIVSASGTFDHQSEYYDSASCPGSEGYHYEEHADYRYRKVRTGSGGTLLNRTGSLIIPITGGYDGVYRKLDCQGNPIDSCETHFGYPDRNMITLTFRRKAFGAVVRGSLVGPPSTSCPLGGANAIYLGRKRVSKRQLKSGTFNVSLRHTVELKDGTPEVVTGDWAANLNVKIKRVHE